MTNFKTALASLVGTWHGQGKGYFPTIAPFDYREALSFELRDAMTVHYQQVTEKWIAADAVYETSHWESGFIRLLDNNSLELINSQSGGRGEILTGEITIAPDATIFRFTNKQQINDARMVATTRTFSLSGATLIYQMQMHTTAVAQLTPHLEAALQRVSV